MVGDALAVWDVCSRHAELLRLPPFPFARLAAALCPDRKSTEAARGAGGTPTPACGGRLAAGFPSATPSLTPSLGLATPRAPWASRPFSTVNAEWLAAQPGDPSSPASVCCGYLAFLRVIENADVGDHVGAPACPPPRVAAALPGGLARARAGAIESQPVASVRRGVWRRGRSERWSSSIPPPRLCSCLAHLAADAPAFGARQGAGTRARGRRRRAARRRHDRRGTGGWGRGGNRRGVRRGPGPSGRALRAAAAAAAGFDLDSAETGDADADQGEAVEPAGGRTSSRRRASLSSSASVPAPAAAGAEPTPPWKSSEPGGEAKWCWYPASSFPALAAWLRASGDDGEVALAAALLEPPDALLEELEAPRADTLGGDGEDDEDATMDADLPESSSAKEKEKDKTTPTTPFALPSDPVAATAAVAAALATRKRGGGTALDGYVGLDRPLIEASTEGRGARRCASLAETLFLPLRART